MANVKMCPSCRAFIDSKNKVCEYCGAEVGARKSAAASSAISSLVPQDNFTTIILLLVNFGLFVATLVMTMKSASGVWIWFPVRKGRSKNITLRGRRRGKHTQSSDSQEGLFRNIS